MSNQDFSEIVQGSMTPDAPSVDDLRKAMRGEEVAEQFAFREPQGPTVASVSDGEETPGDGTVTAAEMAEVRRAAGIGSENHHAAQAAESYSEQRDPVSSAVTRTYGDGRTEEVDEQARRKRSQA